MNSFERVMASIKGVPFDKRATILTLSLYGSKLINCPLKKYYTDPISYYQGQKAVKELFDPDVLLAPFALPLLGAGFGSEVRFFENQPPNIRKPAVNNPDDFLLLEMPDIEKESNLTYILHSRTHITI